MFIFYVQLIWLVMVTLTLVFCATIKNYRQMDKWTPLGI